MDLKKVLNSAELDECDKGTNVQPTFSDHQTFPARPVLAKNSRILSSAIFGIPLSGFPSSHTRHPLKHVVHSSHASTLVASDYYEHTRPHQMNSQERHVANRPNLPSSTFSHLLSHNYRPPMRQTSEYDYDGNAAGSSVASSDAQSNLKPCLWQKPFCNMTFPDDQSLYDHVNQVHIGRKKTDNLCLSCHWANCNVVCSKRDHITSHIKVHIPVKPYKCKV
jgi:hypothetical protein